MAHTTLDPDDLQHRLRDQLPTEWAVRVLSYPDRTSDSRLEITMHHREQASLAIRPTDGGWKVTARSPGQRGSRRLLHPADADTAPDLDRCLDHAVVRAYQYANTGQFVHE